MAVVCIGFGFGMIWSYMGYGYFLKVSFMGQKRNDPLVIIIYTYKRCHHLITKICDNILD